jgi:hypothetical protein
MRLKTADTPTSAGVPIVVYTRSWGETILGKAQDCTKKEKRSKKERKQRPVETAGAVEKRKTVFPQLLEPDKTSGSQLPQARLTINQRDIANLFVSPMGFTPGARRFQI